MKVKFQLKKEKVKKIPQEVLDAQNRVDSAAIRNVSENELNALRDAVRVIKERYGIKD